MLEEKQPLLEVAEPQRDGQWGSDGIAAIGTPARDFVRISSLPASIFRSEEENRRCMACGETGKCVTLRPCGHVVLCRACSDFVYTCPHCGQYISGVNARNASEGSQPGSGSSSFRGTARGQGATPRWHSLGPQFCL